MNKKKIPENTHAYKKHFSESRFERKIRNLSGKILRPAVTLYYIMKSPKTPLLTKVAITGALGYLILPTDLIPDFIPIAGYTDDLAALIALVKQCSKHITPEIRQQTDEKIKNIIH